FHVCFSACTALVNLFSRVFFSLLPPPPSSTLFPYTTLFRSQFGAAFEVGNVFAADFVVVREGSYGDAGWRPVAGMRVTIGRYRLDRKSTRLNSSHEWISYAVFCLKKKKTTREKTDRATGRRH